MARNTWWVEFSWSYSVKDSETGEWVDDSDFHSCRFHCAKKDIPRMAREYAEGELKGEEYASLKIHIDDQYITTDCEV